MMPPETAFDKHQRRGQVSVLRLSRTPLLQPSGAIEVVLGQAGGGTAQQLLQGDAASEHLVVAENRDFQENGTPPNVHADPR